MDSSKHRMLSMELDFNEELMEEDGVDLNEWWDALDHDFGEYGFTKIEDKHYVSEYSHAMAKKFMSMFIYLIMNDLFKMYVKKFICVTPEGVVEDSYQMLKDLGTIS